MLVRYWICRSSFLLEVAWVWGRIGHQVSARIAEDRLSPAALAAIRTLLGPGVSLADVSSWADEQREIPGRSYSSKKSRLQIHFAQQGMITQVGAQGVEEGAAWGWRAKL